jgi:S-DNA-T family DNA segregation ATPase FtsK/SpoIIIE
MATWGPSRKREQQRALPAARSSTPARRAADDRRKATGARSGGPGPSGPVSRARYSKSEDVNRRASRREQATGELRRAIAGRENEFVGLLFVAVAVILAAAIYFGLAGILGDGIDWLVGALTGLGRHVMPVLLLTVGIALIHSARSSARYRLTFGWTFIALAALGILHVARGPEGFSVNGVTKAGGVVGWAVAEPLRTLLADFGAIVVMVALAIGGGLLITQASLRTLASRTGHGAVALAKPVGRATRKALGNLSSLSSDGAEHDDAGDVVDDEVAEDAGETEPLALPAGPYDAADDFGDENGGPHRRRRKAAAVDGPYDGETTDDEGAGGQGSWVMPPVSLLHRSGSQIVDEGEAAGRGRILQQALESHGVDTTLAGMTMGPTVTRYELELGAGVKVARVTSLQRDIAYALAATDVRILAPIPGKSAIGVEVPNHTRHLVALGDVLLSAEAMAANGPLDVVIGKDIAGQAVFLDLAATPHVLIAGATGAGKSSCINCILASLLMRRTPDQVRLILVDPKQVEMGQYNRLPHLLTQPVTNPKKAANALGWAVKEMERRYDLLSSSGFRDVTGYNAAFDRRELAADAVSGDEPDRLPYIVVVVDELNDLMMVAARDVEEAITRLAQKARAVGIHLIVATQRPSVNVITGVIKANIPARIAFAVSSLTDSRVILDQPGAEKLVGKGDMLMLPGNTSVLSRVQGSFVGEDEVRAIVRHWREQAPEVVYVSGVEGNEEPDLVTASSNSVSSNGDDDDESMMRQAMELVVRSQLGSTSMLQRKLKVGFARAGRIMDLLEQRGVVGPSEGSKARAVLMTVDEFESLNQ